MKLRMMGEMPEASLFVDAMIFLRILLHAKHTVTKLRKAGNRVSVFK